MEKVKMRRQRESWVAPPSKYEELRGYLRKRAKNKRWQRRYFEANDHYLTYYKNQSSDKLLACIDLRQVSKIGIGNTTPEAAEGEFYIELAGRVYVMKAETKGEAEQWVTGLNLRAQTEDGEENKGEELKAIEEKDVPTEKDAEPMEIDSKPRKNDMFRLKAAADGLQSSKLCCSPCLSNCSIV